MRNAKGFTLIELIMVIVIAAVLGTAGYHLMTFMTRHTFYLPNQLRTDLAVAEALEVMVEGDSSGSATAAKGLRFASAVTAATASSVTVTNQDGQTATYTFSGGGLTRTIGASTVNLPYFMPADVDFTGSFSYFNSTDALLSFPIADPTLIRRIQISLSATQGTSGDFDRWEGSSGQSTSVKLYGV
ncbi:MAG TPA: prepilin-type N-terminal cleavage/methylation domain-containing protein [Candidatus Omnitrophota bacterium]|nr:prepilin-type N-terminal cleavage/methylation domain-containing protein [Candidatus Omnitrophota bacterium]HRY85728.1 prepilin-type N-terminal cleavage/methylation domain-containing protein [Candidatus Omnitrophota bacterium]